MVCSTIKIKTLESSYNLHKICFLYAEIIKVEQHEDYEKETWQMNEEEQLQLIPKLKEQGNEEFKKKNYAKAGELYAKAIGILENFMLRYLF